jgi:hypothetical protein
MEHPKAFPMMAQVSFTFPQIAELTPPGVIQLDPWLEPFKDSLKKRYAKAQDWIKKIDETEGGLEKFSRVGQP